MNSRTDTEQEAKYGRCIICGTPYETYTKQTSANSWQVGKTCPNEECDEP